VQSVEGYVTPQGIEACADVLGLTPAEVSAVATFYTMYKRRPVGTYHVGVCTNTLCAVMGGDLIFERLKAHLGVGNDETTDDGAITLEHIECNAACDYAPVMTVNWELFDNQTPESATELVESLRTGEVVQASRGARVGSWRAAERVLAGFPDDRADEGPVAGDATLAGLRLARERNWRAPRPDDDSASSQDSTGDHPTAAARRADTSRAESETKVDESPADTAPSAKPRTGTTTGAEPESEGT
jgi:NADH-quinone oxidoreductase subunit E